MIVQGGKAIWEGYRNGRRAAWLQGEDYERLLAEPLAATRDRLGIAVAAIYEGLQGRVSLTRGGVRLGRHPLLIMGDSCVLPTASMP
jgi:hypothetical protein